MIVGETLIEYDRIQTYGGTEMEKSIQRANHTSKLAMWAERVNFCRSSGLTVRQWCEENGIAQCTYYSWQKKVFQAVRQQETYFEEIDVSTAGRQNVAAIIRIGNVQAEICYGADAETVRNVIAALKSC